MSLSMLDGFLSADRAPMYVPAHMHRDNVEQMRTLILIAKMVINNGRLSAKALLGGELDAFDGIVHENGCHKRAAFVVQAARDPDLLVEAERVCAEFIRVDLLVQKALSSRSLPQEKRTCREIFKDLKLDLCVSPQMLFLMQNHFVTVGKVYQLDREGREIAARIDYPTLVGRLKVRKLGNREILEAMIRSVQSALGLSSIEYIQAEAALTGEGELVKRLSEGEMRDTATVTGGLHRRCTPAFFEMKTILQRAKGERTLFLVKQHVLKGERPFGIFYRYDGVGAFAPLSGEEVAGLHAREPVFVLQGVTPLTRAGAVAQIDTVGFETMCLINAACIPQYGQREVTELPDASELKKYQQQSPPQFTIAHTYPNSVERELKNIV